MYAVEFYIFAFLLLASSLLSVTVRHILYASFFQMQTVVALAGILAGLNARFVSFSVLSMSSATMLVFLMFALIIFDIKHVRSELPRRAESKTFACFLFFGAQAAYMFFKPDWQSGKVATDFSLPVLGDILYTEYALCVVIFSALILSCMVGISTLLAGTKMRGGRLL